jgi:hypothetical protein
VSAGFHHIHFRAYAHFRWTPAHFLILFPRCGGFFPPRLAADFLLMIFLANPRLYVKGISRRLMLVST